MDSGGTEKNMQKYRMFIADDFILHESVSFARMKFKRHLTWYFYEYGLAVCGKLLQWP